MQRVLGPGRPVAEWTRPDPQGTAGGHARRGLRFVLGHKVTKMLSYGPQCEELRASRFAPGGSLDAGFRPGPPACSAPRAGPPAPQLPGRGALGQRCSHSLCRGPTRLSPPRRVPTSCPHCHPPGLCTFLSPCRPRPQHRSRPAIDLVASRGISSGQKVPSAHPVWLLSAAVTREPQGEQNSSLWWGRPGGDPPRPRERREGLGPLEAPGVEAGVCPRLRWHRLKGRDLWGPLNIYVFSGWAVHTSGPNPELLAVWARLGCI